MIIKRSTIAKSPIAMLAERTVGAKLPRIVFAECSAITNLLKTLLAERSASSFRYKMEYNTVKINHINSNNMRNDAYSQFHTEFRNLAYKFGTDALKITPQFQTYLQFYERVNESLKKIRKSALTKKIHDADKARYDIWKSLVEINTASLKHFESQVQEAAHRLKIAFDTYGNIAKKPLNEQTSAVCNILQKFEGEYAKDVATIGISDWVAVLKARNNTIESLIKNRSEEAASKCDIVLRKARAELDEAYRAIIERINALIVVEGAENYEQFVTTLNTIIATYAANIGRKSTNKEV